MYIAIIKYVGDLKDKSLYKGLPDFYPVECYENESREELEKIYPKAKIFTLEGYRGYRHGMDAVFEKSKKPGFLGRLFGAKK